MFMTAWVFEARHCPTLPNEIKKTKLTIYTEPQAGINILLPSVEFRSSMVTESLNCQWLNIMSESLSPVKKPTP